MNDIRSAPWSQIQHTSLAKVARIFVGGNLDLAYHNADHVVSMYQYLDDSNEPYDEALDWAVLFHDIVYDANPKKELRSAEKFLNLSDRYEGCTPDIWERDRVYRLILHTEQHVVTSCERASAIVRADLHGLTNKLTCYQNFGKIMSESMKLYNIDDVTFAKNSEDFMRGLMFRVGQNVIADNDHADFYVEVAHGIDLTIKLAQLLQGKLK